MLMLVCLSLVASALAQLPVPAVSGQANCRAQCMLLPPAQKRDCIELCGADSGKPSWIPSFLDNIEWRNFDGETDNTWFPTDAGIEQVPSMWDTSKFIDECESRCVTLPYPFSIECSAQCPRLDDFGTANAGGIYGQSAVRARPSKLEIDQCFDRCRNSGYINLFSYLSCNKRCVQGRMIKDETDAAFEKTDKKFSDGTCIDLKLC